MNNSQKERAKELAGRILVEEINNYLDGSNSPVKNGKFKPFKKDGDPSQLFDEGDMRSDIEFEINSDDSVTVGIFEGSDQAAKAYGHNSGFKGHPHLEGKGLQRRFIPSPNQSFKKPIMDRVKKEIKALRNERNLPTLQGIEINDQDLVDEILGDF